MDSSCLHYKVGKGEEKKKHSLFSGLNLVIIYIVWRDKHLEYDPFEKI